MDTMDLKTPPLAARLDKIRNTVQKKRKLRVTLVRTPVVFLKGNLANEAVPALAFAYLSAFLRAKDYTPHWVDGTGEGLNQIWPFERFSDCLCQGLTVDEIIQRIPKDSEVIGIHAMFSNEWPVVREITMAIRENFPHAIFVAGGEHITALTEYSLRDCPALDYVVRGEGEENFFNLLEFIAGKQSENTLSSIGYLDQNDHYIQTSHLMRMRSLDQLPWPWWPEGYLQRFWQAGKSFGPQSLRDMPMMITRGCPYQCTFCSNKEMWTTRYVLRDIDDIIAEIKHYIKTYEITAIQLYDLTAVVKRSWIMALTQRLLKENIKVQWDFPSGTRSEILDQEVLERLKQIGANYICYAPESGSPRMLKILKKQVDLDNMTQSFLIAKKLGLVVRVNTII
ncbi:B12-binding domain-containing radical SAM protein, partial [Magnetococcales bacterium HHB-1]